MYICFHVNEDISIPILYKCYKVSQFINSIFMAQYMLGITLNNNSNYLGYIVGSRRQLRTKFSE